MMHLSSSILDYTAGVYDAAEILFRTDERTNGQGDSRSLMQNAGKQHRTLRTLGARLVGGLSHFHIFSAFFRIFRAFDQIFFSFFQKVFFSQIFITIFFKSFLGFFSEFTSEICQKFVTGCFETSGSWLLRYRRPDCRNCVFWYLCIEY